MGGSMLKQVRLVAFVCLCLLSGTAGAEDIVFPEDAGVVDIKAAYGAAGDGVTDDTEAIQRAISANVGNSKVLYLPNGTYKVSQTLFWRRRNPGGSWATQSAFAGWNAYLLLRGQSREGTIIKLADDTFTAPPSYAAGDFRPQAVLYTASRDDRNVYSDTTGEGNQGFGNSIYNLTIDVGSGNPGAVGIDYVASNWGTINNVTIRSSDEGKAGHAGLRMTRRDNGPALIKNVQVEGFNRGIDAAGGVTTMTLEHIRLSGQQSVGVYTRDAVLSLRGLASDNTVRAVDNGGIGLVTLIDGNFGGGAPKNIAIRNTAGLFARNITADGYAVTISSTRASTTTDLSGNVGEFVSHPVLRRSDDAPLASLNLQVAETPEYFDSDLSNWAFVGNAGGSDDTAAIQNALDSGKSTIYFGSGQRYRIKNTLTVPAAVKHIIGLEATLLPATGHVFGNASDPRPVFRFIGGDGSETVVWEQFKFEINTAGAIGILHDSPRTLVLKDGCIGGGRYGYQNTEGAGALFVEDICGTRWNLASPQNVWARQLNPEGGTTGVTMGGGRLWVLGIKTEGNITVVDTREGGATEILGGMLYPVANPVTRPAFVSTDASLSLTYATAAFTSDSRDYATHVQETRGETIRTLTHSGAYGRGYGRVVPLYTGYSEGEER